MGGTERRRAVQQKNQPASLWAILGTLFLAFFLYVIYSANQGTLPFFIRRLYMFPGGDKLGHFVLLGIASFFANQVLYPRYSLVFGKVFFIGTLILLVAITAEEISQMFLAVILGLLLAMLL